MEPTYKNTKSFSKYLSEYAEQLIPNGTYDVKVVRVCDGDTVWGIFEVNGSFIRQKIRFRNIDTPELKSKDETEKNKAFEQKKFIEDLLMDKTVRVEVTGMCRYYRSLCSLYPDEFLWSKVEPNYKEKYAIVGGKDNMMELNEYMLHTGRAKKMQYKKRS